MEIIYCLWIAKDPVELVSLALKSSTDHSVASSIQDKDIVSRATPIPSRHSMFGGTFSQTLAVWNLWSLFHRMVLNVCLRDTKKFLNWMLRNYPSIASKSKR